MLKTRENEKCAKIQYAIFFMFLVFVIERLTFFEGKKGSDKIELCDSCFFLSQARYS